MAICGITKLFVGDLIETGESSVSSHPPHDRLFVGDLIETGACPTSSHSPHDRQALQSSHASSPLRCQAQQTSCSVCETCKALESAICHEHQHTARQHFLIRAYMMRLPVGAARELAAAEGDAGPLQPHHVHAAYQRLDKQGAIPGQRKRRRPLCR